MTSRARSRRAVTEVTVLCSRRGCHAAADPTRRQRRPTASRSGGWPASRSGRGRPARIASHLAFGPGASSHPGGPAAGSWCYDDEPAVRRPPGRAGLRLLRRSACALGDGPLPDVLEAHGVSGALHAILGWLARWQMRGTRLAIAPSSSMAHRLGERAGTPVETVPLWTRASGTTPTRRGPAAGPGLAREPARAAVRGEHGPRPPIRVPGRGARAGSRRPRVALSRAGTEAERAGGGRGPRTAASVRLPRTSTTDACRAADVHLMSLRAAWDGLVVPEQAAGRVRSWAARDLRRLARVSEQGRWIDESGGDGSSPRATRPGFFARSRKRATLPSGRGAAGPAAISRASDSIPFEMSRMSGAARAAIDGLSVLSQRLAGIRTPMHPGSLRCSSRTYSRYVRSSSPLRSGRLGVLGAQRLLTQDTRMVRSAVCGHWRGL